MKEVQSSDAKTHLPQLLDEVEQGETIVITRHGRPVARIIPEPQGREAETRRAQALIREFRQSMPKLTVEEILTARHEGHKY
ncbi:type II toxin-antitoxin system prevent-host-death family antitoxin [Nitrospirillum sp. BR 11828]|uniref:type II toxin-antitoxin system Phd/YefM family antitoxin n=1 Tax=Nitrospirillum sp. BR 11828 TaxID=3104325 RepID=UPI002ACA18ED|nr:type II toxin-antitoxin system prevent-host-death family antitoxin [Nitrospirillum sp. BR 11828]MDZ5645966.1 type II toxin-antitoxin system prevent-host-death family antitoxin [Nitrospirillum sp. BR 11828]